jgi:hypothetical protein
MTDREMLELCLQAFASVTTANASKMLLKRMAVPHMGGTASYRLAKTMQMKLREHLGIKKD